MPRHGPLLSVAGETGSVSYTHALSTPGAMVDIGGFRLHLNCSGRGSPAVVIGRSVGGSSISWTLVQPEIAKLTRVCGYDRAGFGWSDAGPMPRTAGRVATELRALLERRRAAAIRSRRPFVRRTRHARLRRALSRRTSPRSSSSIRLIPKTG